MADRRQLLDALGIQIQQWNLTAKNGSITISADGAEDTTNLGKFLQSNPTVIEDLGRGLPLNEVGASMNAVIDAAVSARLRSATDASVRPLNQMRMSGALERFGKSKTASGSNKQRTVEDKRRLLDKLVAHCAAATGDSDPFVHDLVPDHISSFLDTKPVRARANQTADPSTGTTGAAPGTVIKVLSDLKSFFEYAKNELGACLSDPTEGLDSRRKALNKSSNAQERHYKPFTTPQLKQIFEPRAYLAFNSKADYFWAPLIGLHLGTRLSEVVTLDLSSIKQQASSGIWCIEVIEENAKNPNSKRVIPIPDNLIDLGLIEYVEHVKGLGGTQLFPHREKTPTFIKDASKNTSRTWGAYLDERNIGHEHLNLTDRDLVFHSFRHTVVTALQDGGTPLADSMQLVGHQAQDTALRTGIISAEVARSVHTNVYSHADVPRMGTEDPLARLKGHLDRCVKPPIDYRRLKIAAEIVREHLVRRGGKFTSGWSKLRASYSEEQLQRIGHGD